MPIIATAGHVDHGKSTLVEALTGRNPDRWAEEKRRGLTIDLGFAWAQLGDHEVGFVDVPGHERFIKNMLAGIGAVDVALFVVAADEGWMPQSEEHLAVLDLLDTRHGVIALTRADRADEETIDLAELEILEAIESTSLAGWPIVRVSPVTGVGMDELRTGLIDQLAAAGEPTDTGRPRLWVDRSFRIAGAGLVVTGTLTGGTVSEGDELMLWPGEAPVRVRGLQRHDTPTPSIAPGTRAALNISGVDDAVRGDMLAAPTAFRNTTRFLAGLRQVRNLEDDLSSRGAFHLHVGSGTWPVQLRLIETATGDQACLLRTDRPVPLQAGDRFILRETGRRAVVAGGTVFDPHPPHHGTDVRRALPVLVEATQGTPDAVATALLEVRGTAAIGDLLRDSGGGAAPAALRRGDLAMSKTAAAELRGAVTKAVAVFHQENPLRPGIPKASLASTLGVDGNAVSLVVSGSDRLIEEGATVRLADFAPGLTPAEQEAWEAAQQRLAASLAVPRLSQLGLGAELLHALVRDGRLIKIDDDLVYLPAQIERIEALLNQLEDEFTVADFRDLLGVTRRQAVPLLEWLDQRGTTVRRGDARTVRSR